MAPGLLAGMLEMAEVYHLSRIGLHYNKTLIVTMKEKSENISEKTFYHSKHSKDTIIM